MEVMFYKMQLSKIDTEHVHILYIKAFAQSFISLNLIKTSNRFSETILTDPSQSIMKRTKCERQVATCIIKVKISEYFLNGTK